MLLPFKVVSSEIEAEDKKYNNIQMTKSCSKKNKQNNTFYLRLQIIHIRPNLSYWQAKKTFVFTFDFAFSFLCSKLRANMSDGSG